MSLGGSFLNVWVFFCVDSTFEMTVTVGQREIEQKMFVRYYNSLNPNSALKNQVSDTGSGEPLVLMTFTLT